MHPQPHEVLTDKQAKQELNEGGYRKSFYLVFFAAALTATSYFIESGLENDFLFTRSFATGMITLIILIFIQMFFHSKTPANHELDELDDKRIKELNALIKDNESLRVLFGRAVLEGKKLRSRDLAFAKSVCVHRSDDHHAA